MQRLDLGYLELHCHCDCHCVVCCQVFENLVDTQKELSLSVQELMKLQKTYKEEEHITHDARIKAADADDKLVQLFVVSVPLLINQQLINVAVICSVLMAVISYSYIFRWCLSTSTAFAAASSKDGWTIGRSHRHFAAAAML